MKRGELRRYTALPPSPPPQRKTPMQRSGWKRSAGAPARTPHPSPSKAARDAADRAAEKRAKRIVRGRSDQSGMGRVCEGCDQRRAYDFSHRVAEGQGGLWSPSNGLDLCRLCHLWIHTKPEAARVERGWRLESHEDPLSMPALLARWGWVLLDDEGGLVQLGADEALALLHLP